jgi:hypothetical protein
LSREPNSRKTARYTGNTSFRMKPPFLKIDREALS